MKSKLPPHPHTAATQIYKDAEGRLFARTSIKISVPSRVAALLPEENGVHHIQCAHVIDSNDVLRHRARNWKSGCKIGARKTQPLATYLDHDTDDVCNTRIEILISTEEWHLIGMLCGKLGITPGQWYLACAAYNAEVEEHSLDQQLATLTEPART